MASIPTENYQCSQCDYSASYAGTLKYHRRSKHDNLKYPCKNCNYSATSLGSLSRHKRNVHDGEKYPCDSCSFKASSKDSLKMHIKSQHEGVRFPCTTCEYEATQQAKLKQHVRKNHTLSGQIFISYPLVIQLYILNNLNFANKLLHTPLKHPQYNTVNKNGPWSIVWIHIFRGGLKY